MARQTWRAFSLSKGNLDMSVATYRNLLYSAAQRRPQEQEARIMDQGVIESRVRPHRPPKTQRPVDIFVGLNAADRRREVGLGRSAVAILLNITPQLLLDCEQGVNRFSVIQLFRLSEVLGVPVSYFFTDHTNTSGVLEKRETELVVDPEPPPPQSLRVKARIKSITEHFYEMSDGKQRALVRIARAMNTP